MIVLASEAKCVTLSRFNGLIDNSRFLCYRLSLTVLSVRQKADAPRGKLIPSETEQWPEVYISKTDVMEIHR